VTDDVDPGLDRKLRDALDTLSAPDLWSEVTSPGRPEGPVRRSLPSPIRRLTVAAFALVVFAVSTSLLVLGGGDPPPPEEPPHPVSISMQLQRTPGVQCTASMPSLLEPGRSLGLTFTLTNVSEEAVEVSSFPPSFPVRIEAGDGTIWDTAELMAHSWPAPRPISLEAGEDLRVDPEPIAVQFPGPLTVHPTCAGERMDALTVPISRVGASLPSDEALARAVDATSGLLDGCRPTSSGSVVGSIVAPGAGSDPKLTLDARCSATIHTQEGFTVVTFVISVPAAAPTPIAPEGLLNGFELPIADDPAAETIAWRFVVTDRDVFPVASATHARTPTARGTMDVEYQVTLDGWTRGGESLCGGELSSSGGNGRSATVVFLDPCVAGA